MMGITGRVVLGGERVSLLATGPKVRGFKAGRRRLIFKGDSNPQHASLQIGSNAGNPMS
jgi:hypothetical protein